MKRVSLLHTVPSVLASFGDELRAALRARGHGEEIATSDSLDRFLAVDAAHKGTFTRENTQRLLHLLLAKDLEHADLIIVTCSTLTPAVERIRPLLATPVLAIDDAMMAQAAALGERFALLATAHSTLEPSRTKLALEAERLGRRPQIREMVCPAAYEAIQRLDRETHDAVVLKAAGTIRDVDAVVLAQASMAHLEEEVARITGLPTLSSPALCHARAGEILFGT